MNRPDVDAGATPERCPICEDRAGNPGAAPRPRFRSCRGCGLIWAAHRPETPAILDHYETRDPADAVRRGRQSLYAAFLDDAGRRFGHPGRLLDVGCGWGDFIELAGRRGWEAHGVEPSRRIADDAAGRGLRVAAGTMAETPQEWGEFDLITYWDVFMFADNPVRELERALRRVSRGGSIYLRLRQHAVLRLYERLWRLAGRRLRLPNPVIYHPFNFSPGTMRTLGARHGTRVEIRSARLSRGDPYGSFRSKWPVRLAKGAVSILARAGDRLSGGRLILSPSMEIWVR